MHGKQVVSIFVAMAFFCTWVVPPALAESAGDKMAEVFQKEIKPPQDLLPDRVKVVETYKPGTGDPVGKVKAVGGRVLVVHKDATEAYPLEKGAPLYLGDTIVTGQGASLQAALNDKSAFSLAGYTHLVIDKSAYDPKTQERDSLLNMIFGKARFLVSKVAEGKEDFFVKSPTAIVGVRGSDFALSVAPVDPVASRGETLRHRLSGLTLMGTAHAAEAGRLVTTLATGKDTYASFTGDVGPTQVLGPNMISQAVTGMAATAPLALTAAVAVTALDGAGPLGAVAGVSTAAIVGAGVAAAAVVLGAAAASSGGGDDDGDADGGDGDDGQGPGAPVEPCNTLTVPGGNAPESHQVQMGQKSGTFPFSWDMFSVKDQMQVKYEGALLFDTGCVSGDGTQQIPFSGGSSVVTVEVIPNCEGSTSTAWEFTAGCP